MKKTIVRYILTMGLSCTTLTLATGATALDADVRMLGLAMHQETGRNIYLGAVHIGSNTPNPDSLLTVTPPKVMEYRVIARRTSMRSLLGNMLLQGEVASGASPDTAAVEFADLLLTSVQGSLYAGDSFELLLTTEGRLTAYLNDQELVSVSNKGIFEYLLLGWISENGPSTTFRNSILRTDVDGSLLSAYDAHTPSDERVELIASWSEPQEEPAAIAQAPRETAPTVALATVAISNSVAKSDPVETPFNSSVTSADVASVESSPEEIATATQAPAPAPAPEEVILASVGAVQIGSDEEVLEDTDESIVESTVGGSDTSDAIASMDITEYSQRLYGFNNSVIKLVYSKIQYPRRAVRRDIQGALELDVTILEDGSLVQVAVAESSGYTILDNAAVEAAEAALAKSMGDIDPVAVAEYGSNGSLVIPVPVNFILQ
ncbi:MAG: TonB family protein [Halioglobus sp.]